MASPGRPAPPPGAPAPVPRPAPASPPATRSGWSAHRQFNDGRLDGFVVTSGKEAMGYWTAADLPFYHSLATTFPLCDRYFCSVLSQTYPNRRFLAAATAFGNITTELP